MYMWLCHELTAFLHECLILEPDLAGLFNCCVSLWSVSKGKFIRRFVAILSPCVLVNFSYGVLSDREINLTLFHDTPPHLWVSRRRTQSKGSGDDKFTTFPLGSLKRQKNEKNKTKIALLSNAYYYSPNSEGGVKPVTCYTILYPWLKSFSSEYTWVLFRG